MRYFHPGRVFDFFQKTGFNVVLNHFYSPIPDVASLKKRPELWTKPSELVGIDMNLKGQLTTLQTIIKPYTSELIAQVNDATPQDPYYWQNHAFGPASAFTLYGIIRHFKSKQVIEIGSGYSTAVSALAALKNRADGIKTSFMAIEPYPNPILKKGFPGLSTLMQEKVEEIDIAFFEKLGRDDVLFIDSSHVSKTGSDVNYLYLNILPRLKPGVIIHIHDIFFPYEYPKNWVVKSGRFWNEQYLLQAFLACNDQFEVLWSGSYAHAKAEKELKKDIPKIPGVSERENYFSSSFWFRRKA